MKSKIIIAALFVIGALVLSAPLANAQEGEPVVVDEVIAQVNDGVVTLSQLKREMKERVETLKQNGMAEPQATAEVEKHRAEMIAVLINEQLLVQKGKELELTQKIEDEVNKRMLQIAKEQNLNIQQLEAAMQAQGIVPAEIRQTMRTEIMKQAVLEGEVDSKLFYGLSLDELHKYFDAHRDKFVTPRRETRGEREDAGDATGGTIAQGRRFRHAGQSLFRTRKGKWGQGRIVSSERPAS